jgi:hypothetical protein
MQENGGSYILPVRLDGFSAEVPGLSQLIGHLPVRGTESRKVVENFLAKIGKDNPLQTTHARLPSSSPHIPQLKRSYTDREKDQFLKTSFDEIVSRIEGFAKQTRDTYPHFEPDVERITSRKVLFTFYNNGQELTRCKIWIGGSFGSDSICLYYGRRIDVDSDNTMNGSFSVREHEGN